MSDRKSSNESANSLASLFKLIEKGEEYVLI